MGANTYLELRAVALQRDGGIVAVGAAGFWDFALARVNADGTVDASFGNDGRVLTNFGPDPCGNPDAESNDKASAVGIQADGKIVAVGQSDADGLCNDRNGLSYGGGFALARYNADVSADRSFGRGGRVLTHFDAQHSPPSSSIAEAIVIQKDGKLVVAGLGAGYDFGLARYTTRGRVDRSFGQGGQVLTDFGSG